MSLISHHWARLTRVRLGHSAMRGKPPLTWLATARAQIEMTIATGTSDTEPRFVGVVGVERREATAEGGLGLMPATPTLAKLATGYTIHRSATCYRYARLTPGQFRGDCTNHLLRPPLRGRKMTRQPDAALPCVA